MDDFVSIGGHHIDHLQFLLQYFAVGLLVYKCQARAASPDVVAISRAVAVVPVPVLVYHSGIDPRQFSCPDSRQFPKEAFVDAACELLITFTG